MKLCRSFVGMSWVLLLCATGGFPCAALGQVPDQTLPQRVPKAEPTPPAPTPKLPSPQSEAVTEETTILIEKLKGIVIVKSRQEIKEEGVTNVTGMQVVDIPLLSRPDFRKIGDWYLGRSITMDDVKSLENDIILYCRKRSHPLVDVIVPIQDLSTGVLQLWFLEGKVGKVTIENKGHKWFADSIITNQVNLHPGDTVDLKKLTDDLDWVNRNPFRQVNTVFKAGSEVGQSDVALEVADRLPVRAFVGYENSGTQFTGQDRLLAGFNWGNVFGLDQQLNYQYTTDVDFSSISAHSASYIIPLPWRHTLTLMGAYADATAAFGNSTAQSKGTSYQTSMRYAIPMRLSKDYISEFTAGFDYKNTDNNLEFGGQPALSSTRVEVDQFQLGYSGLLIDRYGQTTLGLETYLSPGGMTSDNNDPAFNELRPDSKAYYVYGRVSAERITLLPAGFSWVLHGFGQYTTERLTPSEEMGIGGFGTVRGYGERLVNGDNGYVINNEIRTPAFAVLQSLIHLPWDDHLQLLAFFDYGLVQIKDYNLSDAGAGLQPETDLASLGVGLRYNVRQNLAIRFDYGFQLINKEPGDHQGGHVGVLLSF